MAAKKVALGFVCQCGRGVVLITFPVSVYWYGAYVNLNEPDLVK